ncbi:pyrimidine utilization flavin reductase protein F [Paraburkholderia jirisanensis]
MLSEEQLSYRAGMARLGAAVHVVTSDGVAGKAGIAASAVCSVTDTPPTLLVCVNQQSSAHNALIRNGVLCVNTLSASHEALSRKFGAGVSIEERFAGTTWSTLKTGAPVLEDALVAFDCKVVDTLCQGTHSVFICEVQQIKLNDGEATGGLIYFDRRYHGLQTTSQASP